MKNDEYYMKLALTEAKKAYRRGEVPVGAVIVYNDKVLGKGYNLREHSNNLMKHAEIIALKKANQKLHNWRLENATIYITLFPCPMCASAIVQSRIKKVVIASPTKDLKVQKIVNLIFEGDSLNKSIDVIEGVLKQESQNLLSEFFKERRSM